jgi:phosphate transport system substrate-binding protein
VREPIHVLSIEGVMPSQETVANNSYPLRSTLYIIGRAEPEGAYRTFVGWIQGIEGQMVIQSQYAPLP